MVTVSPKRIPPLAWLMAASVLPCMALLTFGFGIAPANSDSGTSVTNQKSLFALRSPTVFIQSPLATALLCCLAMAALTDAKSPMTALEESRNAIALSAFGADRPVYE